MSLVGSSVEASVTAVVDQIDRWLSHSSSCWYLHIRPFWYCIHRMLIRCFRMPRQVLKGLSGVIHAGRLTAIMGASGAGKTSLLNVLVGARL